MDQRQQCVHRVRAARPSPPKPRARALLPVLLLAVLLAPLSVLPGGVEADRDTRGTNSHSRAEALAQTWQAFRRSRQGVGAEIVGGVPVAEGVYPFVTEVVIDFEDSFITCGGSLIAPGFVLTSAHCVDDARGRPYSVERFTLAIGQVDLTKVEDANLRGVTSIAIHPAWNPRRGGPDVAVLTLDESVPADIAQPVALVGSGDTQYERIGQPSIVVGWGRTSGNGLHSDQLLEAELAVVADKPCNRAFPSFAATLYYCARQTGVSSCNGDSGGPVLIPGSADAAPRVSRKADHHKQDAQHERKRKRRPTPPLEPLPPPPLATIQTGIIGLGRVGCPPGFPEAPVQLSAPVIRDFIAGVVGAPAGAGG